MPETDAEIFEWKEPPGAGSLGAIRLGGCQMSTDDLIEMPLEPPAGTSVRGEKSGNFYTHEKVNGKWRVQREDRTLYTWSTILVEEGAVRIIFRTGDVIPVSQIDKLPVLSVIRREGSDKLFVKTGSAQWLQWRFGDNCTEPIHVSSLLGHTYVLDFHPWPED